MTTPGSAGPQPGMSREDAKPELGGPRSAEPQPYRLMTEAKLGLGDPGVDGPREGWYSRGYLPHFDSTHVLQSITFRLADSLPQSTLRELEEELKQVPPTEQNVERRKRIEHWLDSGMGCCALGHPQVAAVMQDTLAFFEPDRYELIAWCVMPNHVHVLIEPRVTLSKIVQSWKSYTGRWALERNTELGLKIPGAELELGDAGRRFWMRDYWDRYIRDDRHFHQAVAYIHGNPVKAGLCREPWDWPWSSAFPGNAGLVLPSCESAVQSWERRVPARLRCQAGAWRSRGWERWALARLGGPGGGVLAKQIFFHRKDSK